MNPPCEHKKLLHYSKFDVKPGLLDLSFNDWHHKVRLSYDAIESEEQAKVFLSDIADNTLSCYGFEILDQLLDSAGCANIVHELSFEIVRAKLFPSLPSRLKCLYAFELPQINKVIERLGIKRIDRFVEVEPVGAYHAADLNWLDRVYSTLSGFIMPSIIGRESLERTPCLTYRSGSTLSPTKSKS